MNASIRFLLSLSFLLFLWGEPMAQLRYGFRFGGEFANARIKNSGDYTTDNRSGFSGGLDLEYQFEKCGFAPDIAVVYTRYNTRVKSATQSPTSSGRDFIEIPLHLKYKFWLKSAKKLVAPMVYTGPSVMFRVSNGKDSPLATKRVQPGWDAGIGFDIINFIQITGGYRFGLGNAVSDFNGMPSATLHTNGWNVAATILFDF